MSDELPVCTRVAFNSIAWTPVVQTCGCSLMPHVINPDDVFV